MQQKTHRPVQFEITEQTRIAIKEWIQLAQLRKEDFLFPSRINSAKHLSTRQYARIVKAWVTEIGVDASEYGTHTMRRTKASLIYRHTKNLRAVQLLLGHTKLESAVRYLGIEVVDAHKWLKNRSLLEIVAIDCPTVSTFQPCSHWQARLDGVSPCGIRVLAMVGIKPRFLLAISTRVHITPFAGTTLTGIEEGGLAGWRCTQGQFPISFASNDADRISGNYA